MTIERRGGLRFALRDWMRPPRPHGEAIEGRTVSFLELFYDLVFVVFVAQVAHALAIHPRTASGVRSFARAVHPGLVHVAERHAVPRPARQRRRPLADRTCSSRCC